MIRAFNFVTSNAFSEASVAFLWFSGADKIALQSPSVDARYAAIDGNSSTGVAVNRCVTARRVIVEAAIAANGQAEDFEKTFRQRSQRAR